VLIEEVLIEAVLIEEVLIEEVLSEISIPDSGSRYHCWHNFLIVNQTCNISTKDTYNIFGHVFVHIQLR